MKKTTRRIWCLILAVVLSVSCTLFSSFAMDAGDPDSAELPTGDSLLAEESVLPTVSAYIQGSGLWTHTADVTKELLRTTIASAESLSEPDYTADSWAVMQVELTSANIILIDIHATQEEIDTAESNLAVAIYALQPVGGTGSDGNGDNSGGDNGNDNNNNGNDTGQPSNEIRVTMRLIGATTSSRDVDISAGVNDSRYVTWIPTKSYTLSKGAMVYELFVKAIGEAGLQAYGQDSNYVATIVAPRELGGDRISEFTNGKYSGWMYTINGSHPNLGLKEQELKDGDRVIWHYVNDYRHEVSDWFRDKEHQSLGDGSQYNRWLYAPDTFGGMSDYSVINNVENKTEEGEGAGTGGAGAGTGTGGSSQPDEPGTGEDSAAESGVVAIDDTATAKVAQSVVEGAIVKAENDKTGTASIVVVGNRNATTVTVELPKGAIADMLKDGLTLLIETPKGNVLFDKDALTVLAAARGKTVEIVIADVDSTERFNADNTEFDISISVDGQAIHDFKGGTITVTLSYRKRTSEDADLLTVYHCDDDNTVTEMKNACYDTKTGKMSFETEHCSRFFIREWINPYTDIEKGDWYYSAARFAYSNGLMKGTTDDLFSAETALTRAMLMSILWRNEGSPEVSQGNPFSDVADDQWYADAIVWATGNDIVSGYGSGLFGPDDSVTREQFAVILHNYVQYKNMTINGAAELTEYTDGIHVSVWADEAMKWAVGSGLITGRTITTLEPDGTATRAETATLLMRLLTIL